jgi:hypothetical protein
MKRTVRHSTLEQLEILVGAWELEAVFQGTLVQGGRTSFEWIEDGSYLRQFTGSEATDDELPPEWVGNTPEPVVSIIGLDDTQERFTMLYADARIVFRVYQMTLIEREWKIWRDAQGFSQRFTATISDDRNTITGAWEHSPDGVTWNHDFALTYRRVS